MEQHYDKESLITSVDKEDGSIFKHRIYMRVDDYQNAPSINNEYLGILELADDFFANNFSNGYLFSESSWYPLGSYSDEQTKSSTMKLNLTIARRKHLWKSPLMRQMEIIMVMKSVKQTNLIAMVMMAI